MAPRKKKKSLPPKLDPILPLPEGTGLPPLKEGTGREIMLNDTPVVVVLPYRAFYFMWEHAERQAAKEYPKYVGTTLDHAAQTWLDAVHAFRNAAAGQDLRRYPEEKAKRARAAWERITKREAAKKREEAAKKRTTAAKGKNNAPEGAATEPSEAVSGARRSQSAKKRSAKRSGASEGSSKRTRKKPRSAKR